MERGSGVSRKNQVEEEMKTIDLKKEEAFDRARWSEGDLLPK